MSNKVKEIAIIPNLTKVSDFSATNKIAELAHINGVSALIDSEYADKVKFANGASYEELNNAQLIVVLGGDGTLLSAVHRFSDTKAAFLGINYGNLGFLTEIEKDMPEQFVEILNGHYGVSEHLTIDVNLNGKTYTALNDATLHRDAVSSMIKFSVAVGGEHLYSSSADGIIVSTPTGSTAYSLSAGGPIVDPTIDAVILSLICPHDLNSRSVIVPTGKEIALVVTNAVGNSAVNIDGRIAVNVKNGDVITINAGKKVKLVRLSDSFFYKRLKQKLF